MALDDVPSEEIRLYFALAGDAEDLLSEQLPPVFLFQNAPHTFTLEDSSGKMLLQLIRHAQVQPIKIQSIEWQDNQVRLVWCSNPGRRYNIEFSTDLQHWETIAENILAEGEATEYIDDLLSRLEMVIPRGFYRVRELGPDPGAD